jgi:hypothetical protein
VKSTSSVSARLLVLLITMSRTLPAFTSARRARAQQASQAGAAPSLCRVACSRAGCPIGHSGAPVSTLSDDCFKDGHGDGSLGTRALRIVCHVL